MAAVAYGPPDAALLQLKPRNGLFPPSLSGGEPGWLVVWSPVPRRSWGLKSGCRCFRPEVAVTCRAVNICDSCSSRLFASKNESKLLPCFVCFFFILFSNSSTRFGE